MRLMFYIRRHSRKTKLITASIAQFRIFVKFRVCELELRDARALGFPSAGLAGVVLVHAELGMALRGARR